MSEVSHFIYNIFIMTLQMNESITLTALVNRQEESLSETYSKLIGEKGLSRQIETSNN